MRRLLIFLLIVLSTTIKFSAIDACEVTVDITNGTRNGTSITHDNITYTKNDYITNSSGTFGCVCNVSNCILDCGSSGHANLKGIQLTNIIHVKNNEICAEHEVKIILDITDEMEVKLGYLRSSGMSFHYTKYCLHTINGSEMVVACAIPDSEKFIKAYSSGMIISMPFLLVTFVVYALLPDRNLHQKALMFYVLTLLIAYILLVTINLSNEILMPWCSVIAYATIFSFMSSFFWMNVICFDIWYTFSGGRGFVGSKRSTERRRLIYYSLYALGGPLLILGLIGLMQTVLPDDSNHNPNIGVKMCFLNDGWANLWYFYLEAGILVLVNVIFFTLTALKIRKVKKETSMLNHNDSKRHSYEKDKQKDQRAIYGFNLYIKLLFAMGVNWSMEVISWAINWRTANELQYIWYVTDTFNAIYGVFIFFIFVFKKKIWSLLQKRYYNFIGKPHLAHTVTTNQTRTSHYSSTNYSTADTQLTDTNGRPSPEEMGLRTLS
ncbi:probable G-protein coupled receptor Mth-like 10 isoform X8 [Euwallacea fornicatus]|uniref:probable G-protein coupled receptor Mth-like 10 isoform X8 n=1 Tax=Euwallacea fornicatus TaxID=995702 RepID=UPI00338D5BF2